MAVPINNHHFLIIQNTKIKCRIKLPRHCVMNIKDMIFSFLNIILTSFVLFYEWPLWVLSVLSLGSLSGIIYLITILPKLDKPELSISIFSANELRASVANGDETDHT